MEINQQNFFRYFDSGNGKPYDQQELINFCVENIHSFKEVGPQVSNNCDKCSKDGLNFTYDWKLLLGDEEENYKLLSQHITCLPKLEDLDEDYTNITVMTCEFCAGWQVTI